MNCNEVQSRLDDYIDGGLSEREGKEVELHLQVCTNCREEFQELRSLLSDVAALPRSIVPERELWLSISQRLSHRRAIADFWRIALRRRRDGEAQLSTEERESMNVVRFRQRPRWVFAVGAVAVVLVVAIGGFWIASMLSVPSWQVARLEGSPRIGVSRVTDVGSLAVGEWLETDASSRARIAVGMIGQVEVEPNTRIRLVEAKATDHRLALPRGTIHAKISAPPRLFFVETPSALAVDLGCEYTLHVDSTGGGILQVTSGWVSLEYGGRESIVPAGAVCATRSGFGPGTPFLEDASEKFRSALLKFDFENGGSTALDTVLAEARNMDSITLWHLLFRTSNQDRARVYDRLAALVPSPEGVTREGVLRGDPEMIKAWQKQLNLGMKPWWKFWQ